MVVGRSSDIDMQFFKDALDSSSNGRKHLALKHLIAFYENHHIAESASEVEYGLTVPGSTSVTVPTYVDPKIVQGMEGRPGVTVYERRVTPWVKKVSKPITQDGVFQ